MTKTGECYFIDDNGCLWLATSYVDGDCNVTTENRLVEE